MIPTIYTWLLANSTVTSLLGDGSNLKVYRDEAPQGTAVPYVRWLLVGGTPENYLSEAPGIDTSRYQFDVFALTQASCDQIYVAIRNVIEQHGHIVSFNLTERDPETRAYRISFDAQFWVPR